MRQGAQKLNPQLFFFMWCFFHDSLFASPCAFRWARIYIHGASKHIACVICVFGKEYRSQKSSKITVCSWMVQGHWSRLLTFISLSPYQHAAWAHPNETDQCVYLFFCLLASTWQNHWAIWHIFAYVATAAQGTLESGPPGEEGGPSAFDKAAEGTQ